MSCACGFLSKYNGVFINRLITNTDNYSSLHDNTQVTDEAEPAESDMCCFSI